MNINLYVTKDYENKSNWTLGENKPNSNPIRTQSNPKQTQNKPNFRKTKMNITAYITKDYRKKDDFAVQKNKPNSNPISLLPKSPRLPLPTLRCALHNTPYAPDTNEKAPPKAGLKRLCKKSYVSASILSAVSVQKSVCSLHL
ncbi:hypothetical protein ES703_29880 [subsurface metagenome]